MRHKELPSRKGFTLLEMLITVAIIAILVAISIPVISTQVEKARSATCSANRRSFKSLLATEYMSGESSLKIGDTGYADEIDKYKQFVCPSGGRIRYEISDDEVITIYCTEHEPGFYDVGGALKETYESLGNLIKNQTGRIDSGASNGAWTSQVVANLPDSADVAAWAILKTKNAGMQYVWTTCEISDLPRGTAVPVICYTASDNSYTVGLSNVNVGSGGQYNIIAINAQNGSYQPQGTNNIYTTNYDEAVAKYKELLKEYNSK